MLIEVRLYQPRVVRAIISIPRATTARRAGEGGGGGLHIFLARVECNESDTADENGTVCLHRAPAVDPYGTRTIVPPPPRFRVTAPSEWSDRGAFHASSDGPSTVAVEDTPSASWTPVVDQTSTIVFHRTRVYPTHTCKIKYA